MVSSVVSIPTSQALHPGAGSQLNDARSGGDAAATGQDKTGRQANSDNATTTTTTTTICLTIYIFRGEPDTWNNRHVLAYFTSPDLRGFHETVHTQREDTGPGAPWFVDRLHREMHWYAERNYLDHVNAGAVLVPPGREMLPVERLAAVEVGERPGDWNCQHFLCEGLQRLVDEGLQAQEWCDAVCDELMDKILDAAVG